MNPRVTRAADGLARRAFTIADLERMVEAGVLDERERLELVGGEIVPMSPKGSRHEAIKTAIVLYWGTRCPPGYGFAPETALRLDPFHYYEPDFIVFSRSSKLEDVKGPNVLLAVEVARSSLNYDLHRKSAIYASFGVKELWVIDARRRVIHTLADNRSGAFQEANKRDAACRLIPNHRSGSVRVCAERPRGRVSVCPARRRSVSPMSTRLGRPQVSPRTAGGLTHDRRRLWAILGAACLRRSQMDGHPGRP